MVDYVESKLFDNVGDKLITCSKIVFWVGTICVIIGCLLYVAFVIGNTGYIVRSEHFSTSEKVGYSGFSLFELVLMIVCCVLSWLGVWIVSLVVRGFGKLLNSIGNIEIMMYNDRYAGVDSYVDSGDDVKRVKSFGYD